MGILIFAPCGRGPFHFRYRSIRRCRSPAEKQVGVLDSKRLGVHLGIVEGDFDIHVSEVAPMVAFRDAESFAVWVADQIQPGFVVEAGGFHHQRFAVPFAGGIAEPGWLGNSLGSTLPSV